MATMARHDAALLFIDMKNFKFQFDYLSTETLFGLN